MVRFALSYSVLLAAGLAFAAPATAAQKEPGGETESAGTPQATPSQPPKSSMKRLTACTVCADPACSAVRLRGLCTVEESMDALRRHRRATGRAAGGPRHRSRAVTGADYERLVLDEIPEPGRARALPKHQPQDDPEGAPVPALTEEIRRPSSAPESDSLSEKTQSFRPLDLSEETPDDGEASGSEAPDEADEQDR